MTFSDPEVQDFLARSFIAVKVNLVPGLLLGPAGHHSEELLAQFPEGGGGSNVRSLFCTPDGRILSEVKGYWRPARYREEAKLALAMVSHASSRETLVQDLMKHAAVHEAERARVEAERAKLTPPEPKPSPWARQIAALNRMSRSHRETQAILLQPVEEYLDHVSEEVWTKGNVG